MEDAEEAKGEDAEEEIKVYVDPKTYKPDLYAAAANNETDAVLDYLSKETPGTFIDSKTGWTALHWAAINGNYKMITRLLECNASEPYHRLQIKAKKEKDMLNGTHRVVRKKKVEENGAEETKFATITEGEDDEDEEDVENMDFDKQIEVSVNLLKNTPLLWATHKAHLRVIWPLLADGYSPNDVDNMGNTALHLAAATGDLKILKVLIDDGASANIVNHYKNLPIDMAKNKETRDILALAMEQGASNTEADIAAKHDQNLKQYGRIAVNLKEAVAEASVINDSTKVLTVAQCAKLARVLSDATLVGKEYSLDEELLKEADALLLKLEASQDLTGDIQTLQQLVPIRVQSVYIENVYRLERSIEKAAAAGVDPVQLQVGLSLITRCQIEYWLSILLTRLKDVVTANDSNEHDMNRLKEAIAKAEELSANSALIGQGQKFLMRLEAELGMSRAIKLIPAMKAHQENPPEGYYTERDVGHIKETEEYPLPPEGGEYIWVNSEAFTEMQAAIERTKLSYNGADALGANTAIIAETKEKLVKAEKDMKILDAKENNDKAAAIEAAKKAAKKLKKKGGGGKKK